MVTAIHLSTSGSSFHRLPKLFHSVPDKDHKYVSYIIRTEERNKKLRLRREGKCKRFMKITCFDALKDTAEG